MSVRLLLVLFLSSCGLHSCRYNTKPERVCSWWPSSMLLLVLYQLFLVSNYCTLHNQFLRARCFCERHCAYSRSLTPIFCIGLETQLEVDNFQSCSECFMAIECNDQLYGSLCYPACEQ
jgi:hypothetical protein